MMGMEIYIRRSVLDKRPYMSSGLWNSPRARAMS
jgi:hypothetical protein